MLVENQEPVRVAQIIGKWVGGGVESVVMNYYRYIDRTKIQFDFICDEDSTNIPYDEIEQLGGRVILVPPYQKVFEYQKELIKIFKDNNYKIVHSHINTLSIFPLRAAKKAGVPIRIAHSHSTTNKKEWKRNLVKQVLRPFSKVYATDYMCCSELAGRWLFGNKEYDKGNVYLLNNAIDLDKFKFDKIMRKKLRKKYNLKDNDFVIGQVGRIMQTKNQIFTLEIFNEISKKMNSKLIYVGSGPMEKILKDKIFQFGLEGNVIMLGQVSNIYEIYNMLDLFILPSFYEGFGIALLEAQVSNLPCIVSNGVPIETKIADNVEFLDLNAGVEKWANKLLKYTNEIRKNNDKIIREHGFNIESECRKLECLYLELLFRSDYHA